MSGPPGYLSGGVPQGLHPGDQAPPDFSSINFNLTGLAADRGPLIIGVVASLYALTVVAIVLRLLAKYLARAKLWWDDYLAIAAWVFYTIKACATIYAVSPTVGGGKHFWMVNFPQMEMFLKMQSLTFMMYPLAMGAAKCSILFFFIKVFGIAKWFRYWCYFLMLISACWTISVFFATLFMCHPFGSTWDIFNPERTCIDQATFFNSTAVIDAVLDFFTLVAPLYSIWQLKLSTKKKLAISGVLFMGAGELVFTIIRIIVWHTLEFRDVPWDFFPVIVWTNVQESIGVICICLPALAPLLKVKAKKTTAKYNYSATSAASKKPISMGTVTLCESQYDEKDEVPSKGIKRTDSSIIKSSFVMDADEESI